MKQRVVVQAVLKSGDKVLLLRRSQGRPGIVGKYELPGGTIDDEEQPEDALKRHLANDTGLTIKNLQLRDVLSMSNREEGDIQHVLIVYSSDAQISDEPIRLGRSYDQYEWNQVSQLEQKALRDSAQAILGVYSQLADSSIDSALGSNDDKKTTNALSVIIYSDGGSRGNPGASAAAFVIMNSEREVLDKGGAYLGITNNNQAEYQGVLLGLERALELGYRDIEYRIDSMLVVNQLKGLYAIKNRELWPINERINELVKEFKSVKFTHVPRELNHVADALVNKLLDEHKNDQT